MTTQRAQQPSEERSPSPPSKPDPKRSDRSSHPQSSVDKQKSDTQVNASVYIARLHEIYDNLNARIAEIKAEGYGADPAPPAYTQVAPIKRKAHELGTDINEDDHDEDDNVYAQHDPNSESLPRLPIYHPAYKIVEQAIPAMVNVLYDFICENGYKDAGISCILEDVKKFLKVPHDKPLRLGLVGDTGHGKSAVLNTILGIPNVTVENDHGESVTNVVIEFAAAPSTQRKAFAAEVEFFEPLMCMRAMEQKLRLYYVKVQKARDGEDLTEDEIAEAETALEMFCTLLRNREKFSTKEAAEVFLATATSADDPRILAYLRAGVNNILRHFVPNGQRLLLGANTLEDLTEQYLPFTQFVDDASYEGAPLEYSPWPLVRLVRVTMHHNILEQGIIIADLPGLTDFNQIRVNSTKRYLKSCQVTICVGRIDRIENSNTFTKYYTDAFRRRRHGSVILVVTRTDDLGSGSGNNSGLHLTPQDEEKIKMISQSISNLEKTEQANRREMKKMKGDRTAIDRTALANSRITGRITALKNEAKELRVLCRNVKVTNSLARSYRSNTRDETRIPIFCVSNTQYMIYIAGPDPTNLPILQLANTQGALLRAHIYSMTSKGKFATLDHYSQHAIVTFLNIIEMTCSTSTLERKDHLVGIVERKSQAMTGQIETQFDKFYVTDIKETLIAELNLTGPIFLKGAQMKCGKFAQLGPAANKAFIHNFGFHKTAKVGHMDWDEELLEAPKPAIDRAFTKLIDHLCTAFQAELAQAIREIMNSLDQILRDDPAALVSNAYKTVFLDNLDKYRKDVSGIVETTGKELQKRFRDINYKSATADNEHYFSEEMEHVYKNCDYSANQVPKGITMHNYRVAQFRKLVCANDGPYSQMLEKVHTVCKQALNEEQAKMSEAINNIFRQIQRDFEI